MSTYKELLQTARNILKHEEIADADLDAWYLLSYVFNLNRTDLLLNGEKAAEEEKSTIFLELVKQRASHIPLQYITGTQEFMGLEFDVSPAVLIPRQDTELLAEEVLKHCEGKSVLDMCTGSGCIIISVAKLGKPSFTAGADISVEALNIASKNAAKHQVEIKYFNSNLFDKVEGSYDIIVSNPPYIATNVIDELMPEVKKHEPIIALDGREDGLFFYRSISAALNKYLNRNGFILFEIGYDQGEAVSDILRLDGFMDICIKKDLSGLDRVVSARKP